MVMKNGGTNKPDSLEPGKSGFIHAEINALIKLNYSDHRKRKIYLTDSPCIVCSRAIVNANIDEVIYDREYRDTTGLNILKNAGIKVRRYEED